MKKRLGILLSVVILTLVLVVAVACNPKDDAPKAQKYEITFESNGGDAVESIVAEEGSDISALLPADPTKKDLFFAGWSLENNGFSSKVSELPKTMPSENVTYYARWARHAVVVPMLQPLGEDGEPDPDLEKYVPSLEDSLTVEVDPQSPALDLYENRPQLAGFQDVSKAEEHETTVDVKEKTVYLYYNRARYDISFNITAISSNGNIESARRYFGQKLTLPDLPYTIEIPENLRFAGWSSDYEGEKDFGAAGEEVEIGDKNSVIDGSSRSVTLYAVCDEGYMDFSDGEDYLFIPKHEDGIVYMRRAGLVDFKGEYFENTAKSEDSPHIGEFTVTTIAGTILNGYVYDDGHFAYEQNFSDEFVFLKGQEIPCYSQEDDAPVEGSFLKFVDLYGGAYITITKPITKQYFTVQNNAYVTQTLTLEPGTYFGGYWYNSFLNDYCFTVMDTKNPVKAQVDFHFQLVDTQTSDDLYFTFAGEEAGLYCEDISQTGGLLGDLLLLDGYNNALAIVGNAQYQGGYVCVGDGTYLAEMYSSSNAYFSMLIHSDLSDPVGDNGLGLLIRQYDKKGDSALFALCENEDGSAFYSDGFGNAVYTQVDGKEISGKAELGAVMFEDTTPSVIYKLTESDGKTHFFIADHSDINGRFVHTEQEAKINYLYNASESAGEYVGAIVTAGSDAYFLTAVMSANGNTVFSDINKGAVTKSGEGFLFKSNEYLISYSEDEARAEKYEIPTVTTSQLKLGEMSISVVGDAGAEIGKLNITSGGKATYIAAQGGFSELDYEFAYGSVIVKQGESTALFVVDSFGTSPKAFATVERKLFSSDSAEPVGKLYEYKDGDNKFASMWLDSQGETHFYSYAQIKTISRSELSSALAIPMDENTQVYLFDSAVSDNYAIKKEDGNYIAPGNLMRNGEFTVKTNGGQGADKLTLDGYGFAKYQQGNKTYDGVYTVADGVYSVTFKGTDAHSAFKFAISGNNFEIVDYSEFYVVNPATLAVIYVLHIHGAQGNDILDKDADIYKASLDDSGNVNMDPTSLGASKITSESDGIYTFNDDKNNIKFDFRFDDKIFNMQVFVKSNSTLPKDTFAEEGANEDVSKWVTLDEYGGATYFDGKDTHYGFYYSEGGLFRFIDPEDGDLVLRFTLDRESKHLIIYGAKPKPFEGGTYEFEYKGENYTIEMSATGGELKAELKKNGTTVAVDDKLDVDEDNIYTFGAQDTSNNSYYLTFIISSGKLILHDDDLDYEMTIFTGNYYMLQQGRSTVSNNSTYVQAGSLTVKGFKEIAEIFDGENTVKGSIKRENGDLIFTDEYGTSQTFKEITYGNGNTPALFIYGSEMGAALNCFMTRNSVSIVPTVYFDGLGKAYNVDPTSGDPTTEKGYYIFGANPYDRTDTYQYIIVLKEDGAGAYNIADVYTPYSLQMTDDDGAPVNITGVVKYDEKHYAVALADDGTVFMFNGFDEVEFIDSLGVYHTGYFNNFGEIMSEDGAPDNRYFIMDEYNNVTLYYIYFEEAEAGDIVRARRALYTVYTHHDDVYAEAQLIYSDEEGYDEFVAELGLKEDKEKKGIAIVALLIGTQEVTYFGYFTIEDGIMKIDALLENGTTDVIELVLNVDGTADWSNHLEWLK